MIKALGFVSVAASVFTLACSMAPDRYHADYAAHRSTIQRLLILPPEINLFTDTPQGRPTWQEAQSVDVSRRVHDALAQNLSKGAFEIKPADRDLLDTDTVVKLRALYRHVNRAIQLHAYGPQVIENKFEHFDYAVGPVGTLLDAAGADALMLIMGRQTISEQGARTWVSAAVVEPSGLIIWYGLRGSKAPAENLDQQAVLGLSRTVIQPLLDKPI